MVVGRRVHVPASLGSALGDFFGWPRHQRRVVPMVGDTLRRLQSVDFVRLCVHHSISIPWRRNAAESARKAEQQG